MYAEKVAARYDTPPSNPVWGGESSPPPPPPQHSQKLASMLEVVEIGLKQGNRLCFFEQNCGDFNPNPSFRIVAPSTLSFLFPDEHSNMYIVQCIYRK